MALSKEKQAKADKASPFKTMFDSWFTGRTKKASGDSYLYHKGSSTKALDTAGDYSQKLAPKAGDNLKAYRKTQIRRKHQ